MISRRGLIIGSSALVASAADAQRYKPTRHSGFQFLNRTPATPVANRCSLSARTVANSGGTGGGTATQHQQWQTHYLTTAARYLTFVYKNVINDPSVLSTLNAGTALTLRLGVRISSSLIFPGFVNNDGVTRDLVLAPDGIGYITVDLGQVYPAGTIFWNQARVTYASAPAYWPGTDIIMSRGDEYNEFGTALSDRTLASSWSGGFKVTNYALLPPAVIYSALGPSSAKSVIGLADSIGSQGTADTSFAPYVGWMQRLLGANFAFSNDGAAGMTLGTFFSSLTQKNRRFLSIASQGFTHCICGLVTNDLSGGSTPTQIYNSGMLPLKALLDSYGVKLIPTTCTPRTNPANNAQYSTDNASVWASRITYNNTIRSNNGVGYGYIDIAASTQDSVNNNLWRSDLGTPTADGIHPSTTLHNQIVADNLSTIAGLLI